MKKEKYALLVIDMQLVAFDGKITPPIVNGPQLLNKVSALIDTCRSKNTSIIFLQTCALSGQPYAKDVHGWEIHPQVVPLPDEHVVFKVGPSGFENPDLHKFLCEIGASRVIVCGIWSEGCVAFTCQSALELDYDVCLAADGHSTVRDTEADTAAVIAGQNEMLMRKNVSILDVEEIENRLEAT